MELTELQVQRLDPRAILPTRAHEGDAGLDLYALEPFYSRRVRVPWSAPVSPLRSLPVTPAL